MVSTAPNFPSVIRPGIKTPPALPADHRVNPVTLPFERHLRELLSSYEIDGAINSDLAHNLPSKRAVARICEDLLQLVFPGFHDEAAASYDTLTATTLRRLKNLADALTDQVRKGVRTGAPHTPTGKTAGIIREFFDSIPEVRRLLRTDIEAAYEGDPAALRHEEIVLSYPFIEAVAIQRLANRLHRAGALIIPRLMTEWAHARTGIDIHPGARIGTHFFIDHGTGIVIGETVRIGDRVKIYHGVTLGARSFVKSEDGSLVKGGKRHPDVESDVTIYPNSTILGGDTVIGRHSTIGANVFLMRSVPENSLVIHEPTQVSIRDKSRVDRTRPENADWII